MIFVLFLITKNLGVYLLVFKKNLKNIFYSTAKKLKYQF